MCIKWVNMYVHVVHSKRTLKETDDNDDDSSNSQSYGQLSPITDFIFTEECDLKKAFDAVLHEFGKKLAAYGTRGQPRPHTCMI